MADEADLAADLEATLMAHRLARVDAAIPTGVAGECDDCGEDMPRLIEGRCAFCRDGRRPPAAAYDRAAARLPASPGAASAQPEEATVPQVTATVNLIGDTADAFRSYAAAQDLTQGLAARELIERALAATEIEGIETQFSPADLSEIDTDDLLDELRRRFDGAGRAADLERDLAEARERASAAEAQIGEIRDRVSQLAEFAR